jgi:nitrogen regulatory protein P-II 1
MMLITAVVATARLEGIRHALRLFGVNGMTVSHVLDLDALGRQNAIERRTRMDIVAGNADTPDLVRVIARTAARDDRVWVTRIDLVIRIRTGESGLAAI